MNQSSEYEKVLPTQSGILKVLNNLPLRNLSFLIFATILFSPFSVLGQLSGTKYIPGDYSTISAGVTALNSSGVGTGGVTFYIAANYTETISAPISLTATGTAANPIAFQKDPGTSGANPLITAYTTGIATPASTVQDGIWRLVGSDYVTILSIDVRDNPSNTTNPSTMEYGYALYKASASNGCQYVRIEGCSITLNRINNATSANPMTEGSAGIIMMNSTATSATVVLGNTAGGSSSNNKFYSNVIQNCNYGITMIGAAAASPFTVADTNNDIGGNSSTTGNNIINYGGAPGATNGAAAIRTLNQYGLNIAYNTINNNNGSGTNHPTTLHGILNNTATGASATITNNTITLHGGGTTTNILAIENAAGSTASGNTITISSNSVTNGSYTTATTGTFYGIYNTASPTSLAINNNIVAGNSSASASGNYYAISNLGAATTSININGNQIGNSDLGAMTFTVANSSTQAFINNAGGSSTAALSISNNNFEGIAYPIQGTGSNTYISNAAATLSQTISNNTFTNLNINITGNITFISNSVVLSATGVQNINNNSIATSFVKSASGGTVTLFTTTATSLSGGICNNLDNNFSNITLTGTSVMAGWVNTDAGAATKTLQNNTFSNWTIGTGSVNAMNVNISSSNNATTGNIINAISGGGNVTGITTAAGNDKIYSNAIHTLSTSGPSTVAGILITGGTSKEIYSNKIYDLQLNNAGGIVDGISVTGSTVVAANLYNNLIGDLKAPIANTTSDVIRGISITETATNSTINIYYNTIYINASSSGINFSSTGVYHTANATATTAAINLRNNIITNISVPNGTGITVAYRRSGSALNNYAISSDNNLFYAGPPGSNRLIFYDATNSDQSLAAYKARVSPMDAASVTEDLVSSSKFISTSGSSGSFLHLDPAKATLAESGAAPISGFALDYDAQVRQGNPGYSGSGSAPDIGADEMDGVQALAFGGTYNVGTGQPFTSLTGADGLFARINSLGLSSNTIVNITSDLTEDGTNALLPWVEQGVGNYILTIKPDASVVRTVSGNITGGMIRLNGAKRLVINGSNGTSTNYLTFRNTSVLGTTGAAFTLTNGASNNTIRYCTIEAFTNATTGVILFGTSTVAGGNSNNTVSNCTINATVGGNTGLVCLYSGGTVGRENSGNVITNNTIFNYRERGLDIPATGSSAWAISGNSLYNGGITGAIDYAANTVLYGIKVSGGAGHTISNNYIGSSAPLANGANAVYLSSTGLLTYLGIQLTTSASTPASSIKGNTIAGFSISCIPNNAVTASNVFMGIDTGGSGITIGGTATGDGNLVGSNTANGSIVVTTTTALITHRSNVRGINCASTGGQITGNQVGGIDVRNIGAGPAPTTFLGIYANVASAPTPISSNIVGSTGIGAASNSIRIPATSTSTTTSLTGVSLGGAITSAVVVTGNIIRNLSCQNTNATGTNVTGISNGANVNSIVTFSNNTVADNTNNGSTGGIVGIYTNAGSSSVSITNNTISGNSSTATTTGFLYGINTSGASAPAITISGNTFSGNTTAALTTGIFSGIYNTCPATSLSITSNNIFGNATTSLAGGFYAIYNSGAVTSGITINSNNIGTSISSAITYNAVNSATQYIINNTGGAATANLSISNNNFQGITYAVQGTGNDYLILNSAPTLSRTFNSNSFTNLNINITNAVTFISDNVALSGTGTQNVNNNSIAGTFTKGPGGTVTLFTSAAASPAGATITHSNNNFSNITVTGTTTVAGWVSTDGGNSARTVQNNTFNNWTGGTSPITVMTLNITGANNAITENVITNISSSGIITAIASAGNDNIYLNNIHTLTSSGSTAVTGINITAGTTKNVYRNKIYDLQTTHATGGSVNGILISGSTLVGANVYNNLVGDLRAPSVNSTTDLVRGISVTATAVTSTINIYYNTVHLNATSSGTNFSTTGIYHTANATSTTAALNLRNNIISNVSTPKGSGIVVAYRRSGTALNNYASTSNNNLFYAGTPGASRLIFYDGTNSDQLLTAYKARVTTRDNLSVTEDLTTKWLSTSGSSTLFLHVNSALVTAVESGAVNISGFTDDFDGQIRSGNPGYSGSSPSPDLGADEIYSLESIPPVISYTLLANTTSTSNVSVTGVSITDASGINITSGTRPRIYYKRSSDSNGWLDNSSGTNGWKYTEATNAASPFTFTIDYSLLYHGSANVAGVIQYFIVAQDIATTANIAINSGTFAAAPSSVSLTSTAFPIGGVINSYTIPFSGTYNVGITEVFASLTRADGLFASINNAGLMGNIAVNITSDLTEDGINALTQWTESGAGNYTLTIQPNAAIQRTISGNVVAGLIRLDGADRLTIDGSNSGSGSYLSFKNTNTAGTTGTAFTFINGATNNIIRYADAQAYTNATHGVVLFSTSAVAGGNSNNLIDNCTVNATVASNTGNVSIYSNGTVGNENSSNTISNNRIFEYQDRGLDISATGSTAWTISGNSFYNGDVTGSINYAASSTLHGIRVLGGSGYSILNNYLGGDEILASGTNANYSSTSGDLSYHGILLTTSSSSPSSNIKGNTIAAISISSVPTAPNSNAFTGIEANGSGINIGGTSAGEGNQIGSANNTGSIIVTTSTTSISNTSLITGIHCSSTGGTISRNQVGGLNINNIGTSPASSSFIGLYINSAAAPAQVLNNIIGSNGTANSISVVSTSTATATVLTGIFIGSLVNSDMLLNGNKIENISQLSLTASGSFAGISNNASSGVLTISYDTIQNILTAANSNSASTAYTGIFSSAISSINNNIISGISLASSGINAQITGIHVSGASASTISGNIISNFSTASTRATANAETGTPAGSAIIGILNSTTVAGQIINNNRLADFRATSSAGVNVVVTGMGITSTGSGNIFNNKFGTMINLATGPAPAICHMMATNGSFNFYNNVLRISNLLNVNSAKIYGIVHASATGWNYFHNTVRVGGSANGAALRSAAFLLSANSSPVLKNNIFYNIRTGTGSHYAVSNLASPPSTWLATASDYNDLYSSNANTTGEWGSGTSQTFSQWQSASGGDLNSVNHPLQYLTSTYDLEPDGATNCAQNNTGTPITTPIVINTDINNNARSATHPDLGAYEFNYIEFIVTAGNNSPVCSASLVSLTAAPGTASNPVYSWTDPGSVVISTQQNPSVAATNGLYTVTVTDATGCSAVTTTNVSTLARPTGLLSGTTTICSGNSASINITTSGSGTLNGTLSNGDGFSGSIPLITLSVSPAVTTTYTITSLSDNNCASISADLTGIATVTVTPAGEWNGSSSSDWNDPLNWCGGVPAAFTPVRILTGTPFIPHISGTGSISGTLTIDPGASLIVTGTGSVDIKGDFINNGSFTSGTGTVIFSGTGIQSIAGSTVTDFYNITVNNTAVPALRIQSDQNLKGVLTLGVNARVDADGSNNTSIFKLISSGDNPTQDAAIAPLPAGADVTGNVTVQRFMTKEGPNNRIYRYISSPIQNATVADIQNEIPVTGTFTGHSICSGCNSAVSMSFYEETVINDSNANGVTDRNDGYISFPGTSNLETLDPGKGFAIFVRGNILSTTLWDVSGPINEGNVTPVPLPVTYTSSGNALNDGWNLVGNPFPSTIDWNAASGWTKTGIDATFYTTDNGSSATQYATWNGVTGTNGGSRYIATGQGFWVRANTASPLLLTGENVKSPGTQTTFFRERAPEDLLRISMVKGTTRDETVMHFVNGATAGFDSQSDALKLINGTFNLSSVQGDGKNLAINSMPAIDCSSTVNLNVQNATPGNYQLNFSEYESFPNSMVITLFDKFTTGSVNVRDLDSYNFSVTADPGSHGPNRFKVSFVTPPISPAFVLSAPPTCMDSNAIVYINNSQNDAIYVAVLNGHPVSPPVVGTGGEIILTISQNTLESGQNLITVSVSMTGCSSASFDQTVCLNVEEIIEVSSMDAGKSCLTGAVTLIASGSPDNGYYNWYESIESELPVDGQHGPLFVTPLLSKTRTYYVSVVNVLGCEGSRKPVLAEIIQLDPVQIIQSDGILLSTYSRGNQWYIDHKIIDGATDSSFVPKTSGKYRVEVLMNGCAITSADFVFIVTGVEPRNPVEDFTLNPNPATNKIVIGIPDSFGVIMGVDIINMLGRVVGSPDSHQVNGGKEAEVIVTDYPAGVYLVRINGKTRSMEMRFVKL